MATRRPHARVLALGLALAGAAAGLVGVPARSAWAFKQGDMPDFVVECPFSHRLADDPIVDPGQPGASHLHDFFGNIGVDASSTYASLRSTGTTCTRA